MPMPPVGNYLDFEFTFCATRGRTWPAVHLLANNFQHDVVTIGHSNLSVHVRMCLNSDVNNIAIGYFNKRESETIIEQGQIVADQSLELVSIHVDGILLEPWFWTQGTYTPEYFIGYLKQVPNAPKELPSQLIWHFPGRFTIRNLPGGCKFWDWYHHERTARVLKDLVDPTGQILANFDPLDDSDKKLIKDIKKLIDV